MSVTPLPMASAAGRSEWILVSPEMTAVIGCEASPEMPMPPQPVRFAFDVGSGRQPVVSIGLNDGAHAPEQILLFVARPALIRLGGAAAGDEDGNSYHLTSELRSIVLALRDCAMPGEARTVYRLAKSIELLCETLEAMTAGSLLPAVLAGALTFADTRRVLAARTIIDERWQEKLTLETIARACGLNRAKLTRGFRELFDCTVAEAIAERRLGHARQMLLATDKPVSSIGYENGYLNNASFARAFSRRFGVSPSGYRSCGIAA